MVKIMMKNINSKRGQKGQAAIEFLVTYGWAIMAAMIVIGALTYFGITNPATSLPDKCIFSNAFECKDYQINTTSLRLIVINTNGETIYGTGVKNFTANMTDATSNSGCTVRDPTSGTAVSSLEPEGQIEIVCSNVPNSPFNSKDKAKVKVTINYIKTPSATAYNQVSLGEVYSTVQ